MKRFTNIAMIFGVFYSMTCFSKGNFDGHEHGKIQLEVAYDKNLGTILLKAPMDTIFSFENVPKSDNEKKLFSDVKKRWEENPFQFFMLDPSLNCKTMNTEFRQNIDKEDKVVKHSQLEAKFEFKCEKNLAATRMKISLKKEFKKIKEISLEVFGKSIQKLTLSHDSDDISL